MRTTNAIKAGLGIALAASSISAVALTGVSSASVAHTAKNCLPSNITGKTTITFWEAASSGANETALLKLVAAFNASQNKVVVKDVNQPGGYQDTYNQFLHSLGNNTSPDVVYGDDYITQGMSDSLGVLPVATCIASTHYSTADFAKKAIIQQTIGGKLVALPFSASAPVMYYNQKAFADAGIKTPPTTIDQLATDAAKLKSFKRNGKVIYTDGISLKNDPWWLQIWLGMAGQNFTNNSNGRSGRTTAVSFNNATGVSLLTKLQGMVKAGNAHTYSATGAGYAAFNNLFAIGSLKSGLTFDTSAALGTIASFLKLPAYKSTVTLGVAPIPLLDSSSNGGVQPGGNSLFISSQSSAAKTAAAWEFIQFLASAQNMATWDAATGYVPIRSTAVGTSTIKNLWKSNPFYKLAYDEISKGVANNATAGPAIGDYYGVTNAVTNSLGTILDNSSSSVSGQLNAAANASNSVISAYNASH